MLTGLADAAQRVGADGRAAPGTAGEMPRKPVVLGSRRPRASRAPRVASSSSGLAVAHDDDGDRPRRRCGATASPTSSNSVDVGSPSMLTISSPGLEPGGLGGRVVGDAADGPRRLGRASGRRAARRARLSPGTPTSVKAMKNSTNAWSKCMIEPADTTSSRFGYDCWR